MSDKVSMKTPGAQDSLPPGVPASEMVDVKVVAAAELRASVNAEIDFFAETREQAGQRVLECTGAIEALKRVLRMLDEAEAAETACLAGETEDRTIDGR